MGHLRIPLLLLVVLLAAPVWAEEPDGVPEAAAEPALEVESAAAAQPGASMQARQLMREALELHAPAAVRVPQRPEVPAPALRAPARRGPPERAGQIIGERLRSRMSERAMDAARVLRAVVPENGRLAGSAPGRGGPAAMGQEEVATQMRTAAERRDPGAPPGTPTPPQPPIPGRP